MRVAIQHINLIVYYFYFVAHAATGTPNLCVAKRKGGKIRL